MSGSARQPPRPAAAPVAESDAPTWWSTIKTIGSGLLVVGTFVATAAVTIASLATSSSSSSSSGSGSDAVAESSDPLVRAQQLRSQAHALKADRDHHYGDSQACYARGDGAGAKAASDRRKETQSRIERLHAEAADLYFRHYNANRGLDTIDLHGLYVEEALAQLKRRIEACEKRLRSGASGGGEGVVRSLVVIVGRGNNSGSSGPKIRPAVEQLLRNHRLHVVLDQPNAGCVTIEFESKETNSQSVIAAAADRCVVM